MLAIVISACLAQDPSSCKDYRIPLSEAVDSNNCMLYALPHLAKWAEDHPGLVIAKFVCRPVTDKDI